MSTNANVVILVTAENKAGQVLQQVQEQATQTQEKISQANEKVSQSIQRVERNYLQAGAAFAAVGASVVGFATSLDNLEKAQLKVDIAQKRVNDLVARGKAGTEEYRIAQEKLRLAQDNLNDSYTNFIAGIGPQIFSTIFGLQAGFKALGITSVSQLIPAIKGVGTALKTTFITNPVGIAILAITTVIGLLVFNVGGLRDKIVELGNQILVFIDAHLKPLGDAIRFIIDLFRPLVDIFGVVIPESMSNTQNAITGLEGVAVPSFENIEQETVQLGTSIGTTMDQINQDVVKMGMGVEATVQRNIENFGKMGRTAKAMATDVAVSMTEVASATEIESSRIVLAGQAIAKVLEQIRLLQQSQKSFRAAREVDPRGGGGPFLPRSAEREFRERQKIVDEEVERLTRIGQSLALAGGLSPQFLFGGSLTGRSGTVFSSGQFQAVTPGGTLVSKLGGARFDIGATRVISNAREVLKRGFVTRADIIRAQHGFEGIFDRPTFLPLMVGEGGKPEHVKVSSVGSGAMKLVVQFEDSEGRDLGSETLDLANREGIIRIKTRGVRLF